MGSGEPASLPTDVKEVVAIERRANVLEELGAVSEDGAANLVERLDRRATQVGRGLQHQRRYGIGMLFLQWHRRFLRPLPVYTMAERGPFVSV
jgi:hypothetical protein